MHLTGQTPLRRCTVLSHARARARTNTAATHGVSFVRFLVSPYLVFVDRSRPLYLAIRDIKDNVEDRVLLTWGHPGPTGSPTATHQAARGCSTPVCVPHFGRAEAEPQWSDGCSRTTRKRDQGERGLPWKVT